MASLVFFLLLAVASDIHLKGVAAYSRRDYPQATQLLQQSITTETPESAEYKESALLLGQSFYMTRSFPAALPWLEKAAAFGIRNSEVLYMLGTAYTQTAQPQKATAIFAKLFGVKGDSAAGHLIAGQMLLRFEMEGASEKELLQALALDSKIPEAHFMLGEIALYRGDIDKSRQEFEVEIANNPNFSSAYYRLGDAYTRRENWPEAISALQKSIWLNPNFSGPYILLGKSYLKTGETTNAEGALRHSIQLDPQNYSAHYLLGQLLMQSQRVTEGKQMLERSQQLRKLQ